MEYFRYIFSAAWPLPVIVSTGYINAVLYDHGWLVSVFDQVLQKEDFGLGASVFYNNVGKIVTTYISSLRMYSIVISFSPSLFLYQPLLILSIFVSVQTTGNLITKSISTL